MTIDTIDRLFEQELKDMYDAEKRLTKALPKMAKAANSEELREAFEQHLDVTKNQIARLEQIFRRIEVKPQAKACAGMKGLIEEAEEILDRDAEEEFSDLGMIGAARKVEHYEIAAYETLRSVAEMIGDSEVENLLQQNLQEEEEADRQLAELCGELLQAQESLAAEGESEMEEEEEPKMVHTGGRSRKR